jgi:phosphoesterase RecJ-like protein
MPQRIAKLIHNHITERNRFLVVTHQNPDGDAIGSVSAMTQWLKSIGKDITIFCVTSIPQNLMFLTHADEISHSHDVWKQPYDAIILLDSGDLTYAGVHELIPLHQPETPIINIDHHQSNQNYGLLNFVFHHASSATEVLYYFFEFNDIEITVPIATSLFTGLVTDTTNFSNLGTSKKALHIASSLVKKGAQLKLVRKYILQDKTFCTLKLWGIVLNRLAIHEKTNTAYTYITQEDLKTCGTTDEEIEGVSNLLNHLNEGKAAFVFKERSTGEIKVSMRTTCDDIDLAKIAQQFGGGGHKKAAGFSVAGPIATAIEDVMEKIQNKMS